MIYQLDPKYVGFPDPEEADPEGIIAVGGDLSPERLLEAYCCGIFPWYNEGEPILWWSLDPRMLLPVAEFKPEKSLSRVVHSGRFEVRIDTCFEQVMRRCGSTRADEGTWVTEAMVQAYVRLFEMGVAHSFETFYDGQLVGGLYGESLGDWFFGESMFHTVTDASKVAFVRMVDYCRMHGLRMIDAQQETPHLRSLGARPIPRKDYLAQIYAMPQEESLIYRWKSNSVVLLIGSNEGNRELNMQTAAAQIEMLIGHIAIESEIYETAPWGLFAEKMPPRFLNQAMVVDTDLSPHEVLAKAMQIEQFLGRQRDPNADGYTSRTMDIDLIFYNDLVLDTPDLTLPHPRMHLRDFVLQPLNDLIPGYIHPLLHQSVHQLYTQLDDRYTDGVLLS